MVDQGRAPQATEAGAGRPAADASPRPDPALDRLAALAADLFAAPAACLVLRQGDRAAVAASRGLDGTSDLPWRHPLSAPAPLAIADLLGDGAAPPAVPLAGARFYAGAPVVGAHGVRLGTLCVVDPAPRPSSFDAARLADLAGVAADLIDARRGRALAEAAAVARADLLADVSHELRTPLNGIVGFAQVLRRDAGLKGEALRAVERIDEAGHGLLSIVGDALDLARVESGLVRLDPRPFSPARLLEDAAALVRIEAERKGLRLDVELPSDLPGPLLGDPDRLRQVILNLLSNAVKFTESGAVRVALAAPDGAAEGGAPGDPVRLAVTVEDSGIGIARDRLPRLFRRSAQADGGVVRRYGGNGLGLAISKSLVEAMGGTIAAESAPGAGARFTVALSLPRAVDPRPLAPPRAGPRGRRAAGRDTLRGLAILVAEDTIINQKLVLQMLEPLGAAVDVVPDGAAAVAAVAARDYALVLMDMEMPVLGGLDATRSIRALGGPAGAVPIVALTANAFPEQLDLCLAAGMDECLTKPFGAEDLAAAALRWARRLAPADGGPG